MKKPSLLLGLGLVICIATLGWSEPTILPGLERTALDRYVATPDPAYSYKLVDTLRDESQGVTAYILDMTSQEWRSPDEVDRTAWQHWVTIVKPDQVAHSTGMLIISGGANGKPAPRKVDDMALQIALTTKSVVTVLSMVPNQPLKFPDEWVDEYKEKGRAEDEQIAYTWDKFMKTGDALWPSRLPMVKSAVRAMDTVTLFLRSEEGGKTKVDTFVVVGGSKRGWTTWMTAAVDPRVIAIAPIVIDLLNMEASFIHHWRVYGFWAPAIGDYVAMGLMDQIGTTRFHDLMKLVEPYEYRARFTMPKYLINASGDQFFCPDSSQFYYEDLIGEKHLRYVPNTDHGLKDSDAVESLAAYYGAILTQTERPNYDWKFLEDGAIQVTTKTKPAAVKLWQATNPNARDFRLMTIGTAWTSTDLTDQGDGVYVGRIPAPEKGWTAFFVEMTYPSGMKVPFKFTTGIKVLPDVYPFTYPPQK